MSMFGISRLPRNIVFGAGQRAALGGYAGRLGKRALVVTDARMATDAEFLVLIDGLKKTGLATEVFDGVAAELPVACIAQAVEKGRAFGCDLVVGIGGGSCMDAAKATALLVSHGGRPGDYYGEFKVPGPLLPLILLPTTSGTGSEVTPVAVLSDPERALKVGISSPYLIADTAICDPELTYGCPPALTAASGADAMTHAIEAFTAARRAPTASTVHEHVFVGKNMFSDHYARLAIAHIAASLERAYVKGDDREARARMMMGALAAGLAFSSAGTAAAHAIQYPVGTLTHTPHGAGVAVLLPYVMEFNRPACMAELAEVGAAMGLAGDGPEAERSLAAIDAVERLFAAIGLPKSIAGLGITEAQLPQVAEQALGIGRLVKNNPRPLDADGMAALVRAAFRGDRGSIRSGR